MTLAAALTAMTTDQAVPLDLFALIGALVWAIGWLIEVMADRQNHFRAIPENKEAFIKWTLGLVASPQLLWRDYALVGDRNRSLSCIERVAVLGFDIACVCLCPLSAHQWCTNA